MNRTFGPTFVVHVAHSTILRCHFLSSNWIQKLWTSPFKRTMNNFGILFHLMGWTIEQRVMHTMLFQPIWGRYPICHEILGIGRGHRLQLRFGWQPIQIEQQFCAPRMTTSNVYIKCSNVHTNWSVITSFDRKIHQIFKPIDDLPCVFMFLYPKLLWNLAILHLLFLQPWPKTWLPAKWECVFFVCFSKHFTSACYITVMYNILKYNTI